MENSKVSILMNCYNGEKYLEQAITSVLEQTHQNWELIFWDNQSTDKSYEIFKNFHDKRLKYYCSKEHTTQYKARELAIRQASGDFIAFLDVDDTWNSNKLEIQLKLFKDKTIGLACSNYIVFYEQKNISIKYFSKLKPEGFVVEYLFSDYYVGLLTLIIRKDIIDFSTYIFDDSFQIIGDFDLVMRLAKKWKIGVVQIPLATYRVHGENESIKKIKLKGTELKKWYDKNIYDPYFGMCKNINYIDDLAMYINSKAEIIDGNNFKATKYIIKINNINLKIKAILLIITPSIILRRIINT
jgi:glycosyltransferase involved in cell wall biosynthesis